MQTERQRLGRRSSLGVLVLLVLLPAALPGCDQYHYRRVQPGELNGRIRVEWLDRDLFRFSPHPEQPLAFKRANGETIIPGEMITDGGSIPRPLWMLRDYSPWGYAPAFIVHDWLFEAHHCGLPAATGYDVDSAADVMSEVIKTMMETDKYGGRNELVLYSMDRAVRSQFARKQWEQGSCGAAPGTVLTEAAPIAVFELEYSVGE
jgi:Protein of unknown function (DUF1353)